MITYPANVPETRRAVDWRTRAACLGRWAEMHPDNDEREIENARQVCAPCPVRNSCLADAIRTGDDQHGIRAGLKPNERRAVAAELQRRADAAKAAV